MRPLGNSQVIAPPNRSRFLVGMFVSEIDGILEIIEELCLLKLKAMQWSFVFP